MNNPLDSISLERLEELNSSWSINGALSIEEARNLIQIALTAKQNEKLLDGWIKCSEKLPDGKKDVQLFCDDTREQFVGFHRGGGAFQFFSMNDVVGVCEPTHWMPLPAAPKPE